MALTFLNLPAPASNSSGAAVDVSALGPQKTICVSGLGTAFALIEASNDEEGDHWSPVTQFFGDGSKDVVVACRFLRATTTNYRTGDAPTVSVGAETGTVSFAELVATPGEGQGDGVDVGAFPGFKTVQVAGTFKGACNIEVSNDGGTTYTQAVGLSFQSGGGIKSAIVNADYMRVTRSAILEGGAIGTPVVNIAACDLIEGGGGAADPWLTTRAVQMESFTATSGSFYVLGQTGDDAAVTLPSAASAGATGRVALKIDQDADDSWNINPNGADTIDGDAQKTLTGGGSSVILLSDGVSRWYAMAVVGSLTP